jgi:hypothetical protein
MTETGSAEGLPGWLPRQNGGRTPDGSGMPGGGRTPDRSGAPDGNGAPPGSRTPQGAPRLPVRAAHRLLTGLRMLDPGRVLLRTAVRTLAAALAALLISGAVGRAAGVPGGVVVIATVVAVMVSRTLHATSLAHRLSALLYVPAIGIVAAFTGRVLVSHTWLGAAAFVTSVGGSRYLIRFGGKVRRFGRLALTPLISVLVVPVPPSVAKAAGPLWGGGAGLIAVVCVIAAQYLPPVRPAKEAAAAALDLIPVVRWLRILPPGSRAHGRAARALHRTALTVEDRLAATRTPASGSVSVSVSAEGGGTGAGAGPHRDTDADADVDADSAALDALAAAVLKVEVLADHLTGPAFPAVGMGAEAQTGPRGTGASAPPRTEALADPQVNASADPRSGTAGDPQTEALAGPQAAPSPDDSRALDQALDDLRRCAARAARVRAGERPAADPPAPRRRTGGLFDVQPQTRLAAQLTAAMAAAFLVGHLLFGQRWMWTVITAFVVCSAARGRGDVVHRSGLRVAGAFTGAVTGTLLAHLVAGEQAVSITVIFCYLLIGLWLRDLNYAVWAFCVTSLLAVLYTLNGEHGSALIVQRPEGILLGSACGIAAAYFVLPVHTELVMRGRAARALQVLQDLMGAVREPEPQPAAVRRLARRLDFAARDLAEASASARAHRALVHRGGRGAARRPHMADWVDALAACAHAARALAATDPAVLAAARPQLGLIAQNVGQVRRRLGHRPDAAPPRPARTGPPHLLHLNASLAELYERLPAPAPAPVPVPAATPATG